MSKVENVDDFWDFGNKTSFDTKSEKAVYGN